MVHFPSLIWRLIRDYQIEYLKHHRRRWQKVISQIVPFFNYPQYFKPKARFPPARKVYDRRNNVYDVYVLCSIEVPRSALTTGGIETAREWNQNQIIGPLLCNCVYVKV